MRNKYLSNEELKELGEALIAGYYKDYGIMFSLWMDITELAEHLGLTVRYERFAEEDPDKIGFLSDGNTPLKVWRNQKIESVCFPIRTIVLDAFLRRKEENGRRRFTIAHEIAHYVIGRYTPVPQYHRVYDREQNYSGAEIQKHFNIIENRADRLAAMLLMPYGIVWQALKDHHGGYPVPVYGQNLVTPQDQTAVCSMADQMQVSYKALMIRLKELGMLEYRPADEYILKARQEGWI